MVGAPLSHPLVSVTASHMWRLSKWAGRSPCVVYFLWSSVTCVPHCQAEIKGCTTQHSLCGVPPTCFWILPKDRAGPEQGLDLLGFHCLGAEGSGLFLSFSILLTPRGSFRTAVLNPLSTVTHDVLMQDTLLWAHPNCEETLPPQKC